MLEFFESNWGVIFSGIGTTILAIIIGHFVKKRRNGDVASSDQKAKSGDGSQIVQAGRDAKVGSFTSKKED